MSRSDIIQIIVSLSFVAFPVALYYSWVSRNSMVFGICLFFAIMLAVSYFIILLKIIEGKRRVKKVKNTITDSIDRIESALRTVRGDGIFDRVLGKIGW